MIREENNRRVFGYVLAGGASSRFGSDKAMAEIGGRTLLARMCYLLEATTGNPRVVTSVNRYPDLRVEIIEDGWPGEGPLGGIVTALRATEETVSGASWNLIVSCDMPFLLRGWLNYMVDRAMASDAEVVLPKSEYGLEPLCACWRSGGAEKLQSAFHAGERKVTQAMKRLRMEVLDEGHWRRFDSSGRLFWNMNTRQDYQEAVRMWRAEGN